MAQYEWLYGFHTVESTLRQSPERVMELYLLKGRDDQRLTKITVLAKSMGISMQWCQRSTLDDKTGMAQHQGIVARIRSAKPLNENDLDTLLDTASSLLLLVLDGVTDPHNLGACLRTADAAGVDAVILPKDKSVRITPTVRKVACGAAEVIPLIQVTNLARTLKHIQQQGVWVLGTAGEATQTIYDNEVSGSVALVMGAEEKGLRRLTRETCDQLVRLPMAGSVSSLNVSVATGICLYEIVRQRG
jgi:23S rRNA (guanosine2251-2'-O)-methyltransferase